MGIKRGQDDKNFLGKTVTGKLIKINRIIFVIMITCFKWKRREFSFTSFFVPTKTEQADIHPAFFCLKYAEEVYQRHLPIGGSGYR
jgi:hypothetical protein